MDVARVARATAQHATARAQLATKQFVRSMSAQPASGWKDFSHVKRVGIIGGGVSGLQTAKALMARGYEVTIFEKAPAIGGVWRSNYDGFGIQVPRELYEFPDYPYDSSAVKTSPGEFVSGTKVQAYIQDYAKKFGLEPVIKTNTSVTSVGPRADGKRGWSFTVKDGKGSEVTQQFDFAVCSTGMYGRPKLPELPGKEAFKGTILHSTEFTDASIAKGKNVVVLGSAKSAIDCVLEAKKAGATSATLLGRRAHWPTPRNIAGLIPFKFVFLSRFGQALVSWYKGAYPTAPSSVHGAHSVLKPIMGPVFKIVEALFAFQLGLKGPMSPPPDTDVVRDFYGYAHVLNSDFKDAWAKGDINVKLGQVKNLTENGVVTNDGTVIPADIIVAGTGFHKSYNWLHPSVATVLGPQYDGLWLYRNTIHPEVPDLAFVGSELATISNIATYGIQAEWLARALKGQHALPEPAGMKVAVAKHQAWARSWMPDTPARASLVLLHQVHYHDALLQDMGVAHRRKGANVLAELLAPYQPNDYAKL